MPERAALVTGASSGIGLAIADALGAEGDALTLVARRPDKLERAATELRGRGHDVDAIAADATDEEDLRAAIIRHRERRGRLDVLVNNAGVGFGSPVAEIATKRLDMQLDLNLRAVVLAYRECVDLLRGAAREHGRALVVNTASLSGKSGQAWLSVYSATKAGVIGFTEAMNKELAAEGVRSTALCPGFVDTPMTEFVKEQVPAERMIQPADLAEAVRMLLRLSPYCLVPEIVFRRPEELGI